MIKQSKGITLIALVITIVILLILAGLSISALTGSGLFQKAQDATRISEIKEIEEVARLSYIERQINEITGGEKATIEGVIKDLRENGYIIKEVNTGANNVIGLKLSNNEIITTKNATETLTYTVDYGEGKLRYFVEVQGKYYEIIYDDETVTISIEEKDLKEIDKTPVVVVEAANSELVVAELSENNIINLKIGNKGGETVVKLKEKNSNISVTCKVIIKVLATGLTVEPNKKTIFVGDTIKLVANPIPEDTTDKIIWNSSNESVATVSEDGTVIGKEKGESTITAICGSKIANCVITVSYFSSTVTSSEYGKIVANYKSGQNWQIFYADEENIYLIMKDTINDGICNTTQFFSTITSSGDYSLGSKLLDNADRFPAATKWLSKYLGYSSATTGVQVMMYLIDSGNVWNSKYLDTRFAEYAIGAPTLELFVGSVRKAGVDESFVCQVNHKNGYTGEPHDNIVVPIGSVWYASKNYWIASSAFLLDIREQDVFYMSGNNVSVGSSGYAGIGYRPVVCLKSSIKLIPDTYNSDGTIATYKIAQ